MSSQYKLHKIEIRYYKNSILVDVHAVDIQYCEIYIIYQMYLQYSNWVTRWYSEGYIRKRLHSIADRFAISCIDHELQSVIKIVDINKSNIFPVKGRNVYNIC